MSPTLADSKKGGINLIASMVVVDGTEAVAQGEYITVNIPVWPGPKATPTDVENMFKLSKPRMCALLGDDNFKITPDAIIEKFSAEWKEENGKFILVKDHQLKSTVMCVFEDSVYNDKATLNLVSMRRFKEGDKSISNTADSGNAQPQAGFGSSASPAAATQDIDFESTAGDSAPDGAEVPETTEVDDLPF